MENKISIEVTEEERTTIIDALNTLKQVLQPKLVKLSPDAVLLKNLNVALLTPHAGLRWGWRAWGGGWRRS